MGNYADMSAYTDDEIALWQKLIDNAGREFQTYSGLIFTYRIQGNELFISRKEKSLTRSTVNIAYRKGMELMAADGFVRGPKKLGTFGASYIYAIFMELGLIKGRRKSDRTEG